MYFLFKVKTGYLNINKKDLGGLKKLITIKREKDKIQLCIRERDREKEAEDNLGCLKKLSTAKREREILDTLVF